MIEVMNRLDTWISLLGIALVGYLWVRRRWRSIMSRSAPTQESSRRTWKRHSYAAEPSREGSGSVPSEALPDLASQLGELDDNGLLDILARLRTAEGDYRFADSRIAEFIPGRTKDRLDQVRAVRGVEPPAPAGRVLSVNNGERVISFDR